MDKSWKKIVCLKGEEWWEIRVKIFVLDILSLCWDVVRNVSGFII